MRRIAILILLSLTGCAGSGESIFCERPIPPKAVMEECRMPDIDKSARRALVDHRVALAECAARHRQLVAWEKDVARTK